MCSDPKKISFFLGDFQNNEELLVYFDDFNLKFENYHN